MSVVWLTPAPEVQGGDYSAPFRGLIPAEPFHPSENFLSGSRYVTPDGTTHVVLYHHHNPSAIAIHGADAERIADGIARHIRIIERHSAAVFHRYQPLHTAGVAGDGGVWLLDSVRARLLWQSTDGTSRVVADQLHAPVALCGDASALYVTSCDDPRTCRLARVDPQTGAVRWMCDTLDLPQQTAVLGTTVYAACRPGLVAIDEAGAIEIQPLAAPLPHLLGAGDGALVWISRDARHVVRFAGGHTEILAVGENLIALDVDHDRVYALGADGGVLECRSGRPVRMRTGFLDGWKPNLGGVLRLGPYVVTALDYESSWAQRTRIEALAIGFPLVDEAPAELRAQLATDPAAWHVLADWLAERGVITSAERLQQVPESFAGSERSGGVAGGVARELVTFDRDVGYRLSGADVEVLRAEDWG